MYTAQYTRKREERKEQKRFIFTLNTTQPSLTAYRTILVRKPPA
jgi:hypothetical protein